MAAGRNGAAMVFGHLDDVVIGALCVWRLTHLLHAEDGPFDTVVALRRRAGDGFWGAMLDCFYCLSLWLALPVTLLIGDGLVQFVLLWPALSGAACLLEQATARPKFPGLVYEEPKE
jgi:hypothetical protein